MTEQIYTLFCSNPHISTDSRHIVEGSIFFALHGESFDGNDYALEALEGGAAYSVVDREQLRGVSERVLYVEDTLTALQELAKFHRRALGIDILAITGSNGKTTTKELIARVLSAKYNLYATRGNLNNHIGVPLTLLSMGRDTEFGVVEMGASSRHEIELLCSIAEPNFGVLTNIGRAHLEGFGGEQGVRRGKGELLDYLAQSGGELFVAQENQVIMEMAAERDVRVEEYSYSLGDDVAHNLEGEYNRMNVATAVAVARYFGVADDAIRSAIGGYQPTNNRSQKIESDRNTLIVDCYNANPSSMQVAIENFSREVGRKVAILGDMYELGEWSGEEHRRVIDMALGAGADNIFLVGHEFSRVAQECGGEVKTFESREALASHLREYELRGCKVLIKGSRGVGLEKIIELL